MRAGRATAILVILSALPRCTPAGAGTDVAPPAEPALLLRQQADVAYAHRRYALAARGYAAASHRATPDPTVLLDAAHAFARANRPDSAFVYLDAAANAGLATDVATDPILATLRTDPRWATFADAVAQNRVRRQDPDAAALVTSDITHFWHAYDQLERVPRKNAARILERDYFAPASAGLQDFLDTRIRSADALAAALEQYPLYYRSIRESTRSVTSMRSEIRASFRRLEELYPPAVFPDVYFVIGRLTSGGTATPAGLVIGTEMLGRTPETPSGELTPWLKQNVRPITALPAVVAHELIHFQQNYPEPQTLLGKAIQEGSADFLGEIISGHIVDSTRRAYGDAHERQLWEEFRAVMFGRNLGDWLYAGNGTPTGRPADLGYYIGYAITRAYYRHARDKRQAIADILNIRNFDLFLEASHYDEDVERAAEERLR